MNYQEITKLIEQEFNNFSRPIKILNEKGINRENKVYNDIIEDYGNLELKEIDYEKCAMLVCDLELLSDETVLFFLPRIVRLIFENDGNAYLLAYRLENMNNKKLSIRQNKLIKKLINSLYFFEEEIE